MKHLSTLLSLTLAMPLMAETQSVTSFRYVGPYELQTPVLMDSTDVNGKSFDAASLLKQSINLHALAQGTELTTDSLLALPGSQAPYALHLVGFDLINRHYLEGSLQLAKAPAEYEIMIDGKAAGKNLALEPDLHHIVIKYLSKADRADSLQVKVDSKSPDFRIAADLTGKAPYTVRTQLNSLLYRGAELSPNGKYMIVTYYQRASPHDQYYTRIVERETMRIVWQGDDATWMPHTNRFYFTRRGLEGTELVTVDPATGLEEVLTRTLPSGRPVFAPTEDYLLMLNRESGPKEKNPDVFELIDPEDRQPGYRSRMNVTKYDLKTGLSQPITFGHNNVYVSSISPDGRQLVLSRRVGEVSAMRPTSFTDVYLMDVETLKLDTLVTHEGFASAGDISPDGRWLYFTGSAESFGRIGCTLPADKIPNEYDGQLFLMDLQTRELRPMTRDFNPAVTSCEWSTQDGHLYFIAENRDCVCLYRMNPADGQITEIPVPEEVIQSFSMAADAPVLAFYGVSASNSNRLYSIDTRLIGTRKQAQAVRLVDDLSKRNLEGIALSECLPWSFTNSIGDEITCRYYLPLGYEEGRQYPMIVNYYGGCSPTERTFESNYPQHSWSALGYVVLIVEPSGASGFSQEFGSRHVNTAGVDPARDIVEAVKTFCGDHPFVNDKKIGCIGASYGGFMTMYLPTVTDIFAACVAHAGISDHSNYWGYGDWGYTYSQVSMAESYPWTRKDLYVDQSPLYRADKIHTPILFTHGVIDNNVPYNNSLQMFTALKLLGRETALVGVTNQQHHILDYDKRIAWHNAIMAWFAKYLQDDPSWWEALYPKKDL